MDHIPLSEGEWKIMVKLWDKSPQTMMDLTRSLAGETGWTKHTVITMLKRMQQKGTVHICEDGPYKTYSPAVSKDRAAREQTQTLLHRLFHGQPALLISDLVQHGELSAQELSDMAEIIRAAQEKQSKNISEETK